jgi:predicted deacylase
MADFRRWHFDLPGTRVDEFPWRVHVHEVSGGAGPATAIIAGMIGDKPLGVLALHELIATLRERPLKGTVLVIPVVNPFGLQGGTRHNPDLVELNRRFPGSPHGAVSDQLAHAIFTTLKERVDCVIDVHSGTPVRATEFSYDYGNLDLTASFAYIPVMVGRHTPGSLCAVAKAAGMQASLIEFGGAERNSTEMAVAGCLNMLRFRGHLDDAPTGPDTVEVLDQVKLFFASKDGALCSPYGADQVGKPVGPGVIGWVANVVTGERLEEFVVEPVGKPAGMASGFDRWGPSVMKEFVPTAPPLLMVGQAVPAMVRPGILTYMVGWVGDTIATPRR